VPLNPMTGQFEYGGESYDVPTVGAGATMAGMGAVGADIPIAFRMMENMPSFTATALFNARRFSNTMFQGGFLDVANADPQDLGRVGKLRQQRRVNQARKYGAFVGDTAQRPTQGAFLFGRARNIDAATKTAIVQPARINSFTARPRIFNRFSSVTNLSGVANQGFYTPFQGASFFSSMLERGGRGDKILAAKGITRAADEPLLTGGILGRMTTMSNTYALEQKQARLLAKGTARANAKAAKIGTRLGGLDENIVRMGRQTGAVTRVAGQMADEAMSTIGVSSSRAAGMRASLIDDVMTGGMADVRYGRSVAGNRLKSISDTSRGVLSRAATEYMGTMLDPSKFVGTRAYSALHQNVSRAVIGQTAASGQLNMAATSTNVTRFLAGETVDDLGKFGVRSMGKLSTQAFASGQRAAGMRLAGATGARALGLAIPGINVIATASLVYDLTKMAGQGFIAAGNFAKDAVKSMQGSIRKPLFGMGFKDNEVAATSRARGVMAIQNSRLNARSMLGAEAGMMAAHFG
jgi:hypothetical protein